MIQKLKQKLSLLARKTVTKEIQGQQWTFSPVSLGLFYELKTSLEPIWLAVQTLSKPRDGDIERHISQETRPDKSTETITVLKPMSVEMAKFRADRAEKASREAIAAILGEPSRLALARILADSLREDVGKMTDAEALEFFADLEVPTALEFLGAFIEVNAAVFGPLVSRAVASLKERLVPPSPSPTESEAAPAADRTPAPSASA